MGEDQGYKGHCYLKKAALFMAGFTMLLTLRVGLNSASFCLVRFKLEEELFSLYVNRVHNAMELFCFIGVIIGNVYVFTYGKYVKEISIFISWAYYAAILALLGVFVSGGLTGHLTRFYWALAISAVVYGLQQVCIFYLGGRDIVYYLAAVPLSGIFVSVYQVTFLRCFGDRSKYNTDLNLVAFQLVLSVMISIVAAALWSLVFLEQNCDEKKPETTQEVEMTAEMESLECGEALKTQTSRQVEAKEKTVSFTVISPILMCVGGLGVVFAFYPGIAPGMLVEFKYIHSIDVAIMIAASIPSVVIAFISELTKYGPNNKWEKCNSFWHGFLTFTLIEIMCGFLFIYILHHKKTSLSRFILKHPLMVGVIIVIFYLCHNISIGVGFAGVEPNSNTKINTVNLFLSLFTMIFLEFLGEGYVMEIKKYNVFYWPTKGMGSSEAFCFWVKQAASNALESLMSIPTKDLRADLLSGVAEPLN